MTNFDLDKFFTYKYCYLEDNEHDQAILIRVKDHLTEAINLELFDIDQVFFIALEGSQNYKLDTNESDVDTKLILLPSLQEVAEGKHPISTTHITEFGEHTSFTDVRNYFNSLRKQNINFIETLFSPWIIVNKKYEEEFKQLFLIRELIARYNEIKAIKTVAGIAKDRYKAIQNLNSNRKDLIEKYGYDGKAVSHLIRISDFLYKYIGGLPYNKCIVPTLKKLILELKQNKISKDMGLEIARVEYDGIQSMVNHACENKEETVNSKTEKVLADIQYNIVKKSL